MNFWLLVVLSFVEETSVSPCLTTCLLSPKTSSVLYDSVTVRMVLLGPAIDWSC